jgi:hypothetical protein
MHANGSLDCGQFLNTKVSVHGLGRELLEPRLAGIDWVCYRDDQL